MSDNLTFREILELYKKAKDPASLQEVRAVLQARLEAAGMVPPSETQETKQETETSFEWKPVTIVKKEELEHVGEVQKTSTIRQRNWIHGLPPKLEKILMLSVVGLLFRRKPPKR